MINTLWITGFFLLSTSIATLSFVAFASLYIEAYMENKRKDSLFLAAGGILVAIAFLISIANSFIAFSGREVSPNLFLSFLALGFMIISVGLYLEKIPGKPKLKQSKAEVPVKESTTKLKVMIFPGLLAIAALLVAIAYVFKKVTFGISREFKELLLSLSLFLVYLIIEFIQSVVPQFALSSFSNPSDLFGLTLIKYVILFIAACIMLFWIYRFIAFQTVTRLFFSIWQLFITLSVLFAVSISAMTIYFTQGQIYDILSKNAQLITFNLDEIRKSNTNLLDIFSKDTVIMSAIDSKDSSKIEPLVRPLLINNTNIDELVLTDASTLVIYNSSNPKAIGTSISNNTLAKKAILEISTQSGYIRQQNPGGGYDLTFQQAVPVFNNKQKLMGVIIAKKILNDTYLDILQKQSGQALILYVNGFRAASTVVDTDAISRFQNLPLEKSFISNYGVTNPYIAVPVLTKKYYMSVVPLKEDESNDADYLLVGTEQQALITATENIIYGSTAAVIFFCVLSIIPLYMLAKRVDRDISV